MISYQEVQHIITTTSIIRNTEHTALPFSNGCVLAEDIVGEVHNRILIPKGTILEPRHIAIMANIGYYKPTVYEVPTIGIIAIGNELIEPSKPLTDGQIRNSSAWLLMAQISKIGLTTHYEGIIPENYDELQLSLSMALDKSPIVVITGTNHTILNQILTENNFEIIFSEFALNSEKKILFAKKGNQFVFGLSEITFSTYVHFEMVVKPFIFNFMGARYSPKNYKIPIGIDYVIENSRMIPIEIKEDANVYPIELTDYEDIYLLQTHGFLNIIENNLVLQKGDLVNIILTN